MTTLDINSISPVGFGSYRVSIRSQDHYDSLLLALKNGCNLIDTSANYTNGESEELIGKLLDEHPEFSPIIVTKGGYVQGKNIALLEELNKNGKATEDIVDLGEYLKHSIHPDFLRSQIDHSLQRLGVKKIDIYLLHNPEYYFKTDGATEEEYYRRIQQAFEYLEEEVANGRIGSYGISSNTFASAPDEADATSLSKVIELAKEVSEDHHFTTIQFPMNLIEVDGIKKHFDDKSLIDLAKENNLLILINRPLNAFVDNNLFRLAEYEGMYPVVNTEEAMKDFEKCMELVETKFPGDEEDVTQRIPLLKQIREVWLDLPSQDAVDQVFHGHLFPLLAQIWGKGGLNAEEAKPFFDLYDYAHHRAREKMSDQALQLKEQNFPGTDLPFSVLAVKTYLEWGVDCVLVGMKRKEYVEQLSMLFK